jgi:hypothetical protein
MRRGLLAVVLFALAACTEDATTSSTMVFDASEMTVAHGCGHGFHLGDPDQTVGLIVSYIGYTDTKTAVPDESRLSDGLWDAHLDIGSHLFTNWCNDVIDPNAPQRSVDEVWQVTGTVRIISVPELDDCGPAWARLSDVEAHGPDGSVISLGSMVVGNDTWGCFAG